MLYVRSNEDQGTGVVEYLGLTLQHYVSQQVEYVISRRKQRLRLWHIIQHLSSLDACLIYSHSLVLLILDNADTDNETKTKKRQN